jgi:hypothetical protein
MLAFRTRFWVNVVGRIVPLGVALAFALFSTDNAAKERVLLAAITVLILVEYVGVYRPMKHFSEIIREQFDCYFEPFVNDASFDGTKAEIRVNIMLVQWTLRGRYFVQCYQQGMAGYPDANLRFSIKRGLCGYAFRKNSHEVLYRDLRTDTPDMAQRKFRWSQEQSDITEHVKAVAAVPLYRERKTLRGHIRHKYFGVLNVDAVNDAGVELLADAETQKQVKALAKFVRVSLA